MKPVPMSAQGKEHQQLQRCRLLQSKLIRRPRATPMGSAIQIKRPSGLCPLVPRCSRTFPWCDLTVNKSGSTVIVSSVTHHREVILRKTPCIPRTFAPTASLPMALHQSVRPKRGSATFGICEYLGGAPVKNMELHPWRRTSGNVFVKE